MANKFDTRQSIIRPLLDEVASTPGLLIDSVLTSINSSLTPLLRLTPNSVPDRAINIGPISISNPQTGRKRTVPAISGTIPTFTGGTVTFPAATGGTITVSVGTNSTLTIGSDHYLKVGIHIDTSGDIVLSFGTQGTTEALATVGTVPSNTFTAGYVVVRTIASVVQNITSTSINQYGSGSGAGGGGAGGLVPETKSTTFTAVTGKIYLTDTSGGAFTATLPAGQSGYTIRFVDLEETWDTDNLTIQPASGEQIGSLAVDEALIADIKGGWFELDWDDVGNKWGLHTLGAGSVLSVNGFTGTVVLDTDDVSEGTANKYVSINSSANKENLAITNASGATIVEGDLVYSTPSGVSLAIATSAAASDFVGYCRDATVINGASANINMSRYIYMSSLPFTVGSKYYLSPTLAGKLTTTAPSTSGQWVVPVGIAVSTGVLLITREEAIEIL